MHINKLTSTDWFKAIGVGVVTAILLSAVMITVAKLGISPFPKPPSLAFAEIVFGRSLPLPVGLLFHLAYVTFWSVAYVVLFRDGLHLSRAIILGLFLWVVVLVVFFPVVGWGFLGLGISPKLIVAALMPHVLFIVFLWGLCRVAFKAEDTKEL